MKLVIIGNGFDLHHGLKTSFNDFRSYLLNKSDNNKLVNDIDTIIKKHNKSIDLNNIILAWNDIENIINKEFEKLITNQPQLNLFEDLIEDFVNEFYEYLKIEESKCNISMNTNIQKKIEDADVLLVFNYTKTYSKYLTTNEQEAFHIHGCLEETNLPLIGFYRSDVSPIKKSDYYEKYRGNIFHKPAIAYKQNAKILENEIKEFTAKYGNNFNEVIIIGYSFGESDSHIYNILNDLLIVQPNSKNMLYFEAEKTPKIDFYIFNYNSEESKKLTDRISKNFIRFHQRNLTVKKFGNGVKRSNEDLIRFNIVDY